MVQFLEHENHTGFRFLGWATLSRVDVDRCYQHRRKMRQVTRRMLAALSSVCSVWSMFVFKLNFLVWLFLCMWYVRYSDGRRMMIVD